MSTSMIPFWSRLSVRLTAVITVVTAATIGAFVLLAARAHERQLTDQVVRDAAVFSETIRSSTHHDMLEDRRDDVYRVMQTMGRHPGIEMVRIFNKEGRVTFSTDRAEIGRFVDRKAESCYACHAADGPLVHLTIPSRSRTYRRGNHRALAMMTPIYNEAACSNAACHVHPETQSVLGVVDIGLSLAEVDATTAVLRRNTLLFGVMTMVALAVLVSVFERRFVVRSVIDVMRATRRIASGELKQSIPVRRSDEIGLLASSFNRMAQSLDEAQTRLGELTESLERQVDERTAALRQARAQHVLILDSLGEGVYGVDRDGRATFVNPAAAEMLGYQAQELIGQPMHEVTDHSKPDGSPQPREECLIYAAFRDGTVHRTADEVFWRKDGRAFPVEYMSTPIREHGAVAGAVVVFTDITERKRAEHVLKASEARLSEAQRIAHIGSWELDLRTNELKWSDEIYRMFGIEPRAFDASYEAFLDAVHPDDRELVNKAYTDSVKNRAPYDIVHRLLMKDGSIRFVQERCETLYDEDGKPVRSFGTVQDITQRAELEQQLWQAQKMEAVGRLAGGVAHDFNNLLTAILGYAELLLSDLRDDDPRSQDLREIRKAGETAASLTRKILAFSRRQPLEPEVLDLNAAVTGMHEMLSRLIGEDIRIELRLDPGLGRVKADPGQIEQVLLNLATNARDAMPQGGTLTIETQNAALDDTHVRRHLAAVPGEYVMLAVSDTGCGMTPEVQARVFEPFFTTKPRGVGTGLGLSTVYGIVKQSGGDIWVYSEPERGATFKVYLPRVDAPVGAGPALVGPDVPVSGSETILLVEDNRGLRELARKVLERRGYAVLGAGDADEALRVSEQHSGRIHLLLTDLVLPGISGVALVERLVSTRPAMKVLYMSGYTDEAVVAAGVLPQRVTFLQKPFTLDSLARKVRQVLDAADSGRG